MNMSEKVQKVAQSLLDAFETGDVAEALANVFIHRHIDSPSTGWSFKNRLLVALAGHVDARGFKQWKEVGRSVKKGESACYILGPKMVRADEDQPDKGIKEGDKVCVGFFTIPVFGHSQTEGEPLPWMEEEREFLDSLPLIEVARSWGIETTTFDPTHGNKLGFYSYNRLEQPTDENGHRVIGLGVENPSVWAHELIHAADHRLGTLTKQFGQQMMDNEVIAEFGGTVLLRCLGMQQESDPGGAWSYICRYANDHDVEPLTIINDLLDRTCACVQMILDTADELGLDLGLDDQAKGVAAA